MRRVFFDHDGGVDDFIAMLLLIAGEKKGLLKLEGVSMTPADTFMEPCQSATRKILDVVGFSHVRVAAGSLDGKNPFPDEWRMDAQKIDTLPVLNAGEHGNVRTPLEPISGQELLKEVVANASEPITLVMTGPLTNLAWALAQDPRVEKNVRELVWMGGAVDVVGNVFPEDLKGPVGGTPTPHDGSAEWNVFWDPAAAARVWASSIPVTMIPLDATNMVPVREEFTRMFGRQQQFPASVIAGSSWALTAGWKALTGNHYYAWDVLTALAVLHPEVFTFQDVACDVIAAGLAQGRTVRRVGARVIKTAMACDADAFYRLVLEYMRF